MSRFAQNVTAFLFLTWSFFSYASVNVWVSAKKSEDHIFLVFHHDRGAVLGPIFSGNNGKVKSDKVINLSPVNNSLVSDLCSSMSLSAKDQKTIDFKLKDQYRFLNVIYGEKLVAFKITNPDFKSSDDNDQKLQNEKPLENSSDPGISNSTHDIVPSKQNADTLVKLSETKKALQMSFPFLENDIGASIFQRGLDLWVVFDVRKDFYIPESQYIDSWSQYIDPMNTILKIKLKKPLSVTASKNSKNWVLNLSSTTSTNKSKSYIISETKSDTLTMIQPIKSVPRIITVRDKDIGDLLVIAPLPEQNSRLDKEKNMIDYKIIPSTQGVALSLISEDVHVSYSGNDKAIEVVSNYKIPDLKNESDSYLNDSTNSVLLLDGMLMNGDQYLVQKNILLRAIVDSKDKSSQASAEMTLAKFYFANSMYHESKGMIDLVSKDNPDQINQVTPGLMNAVSMVMMGDNIGARTVFADLKTRYKTHPSIVEINIWDRYNEHSLGANISSIGILDSHNLVNSYHDFFYWKLMLAELAIANNTKNFKLIDQLLSNARQSSDLLINNNLKFYKAQYYYLQGQDNLAEQLLQEIKVTPANGRDFMMADLQLIKILYEQRKIDWISAVQKLHELRFVWRGDDLELKLLTSLAIAYKQNGDVINAIRTYKYILDAFGKQGNNTFFVTAQIVELYQRIFLSEEMQELDDFTVIALFYEFKDFTPIGVEGDKAVLGIARRMLNLDLLDMAIGILQHQVTYRLRGVERIITSNHLALVYLMDKKPQEALKVMEETDKENTNFVGYKQRNELKAKALIDLGRYQEALDYMKGDPSEDVVALKLEAYFMANKWTDYITLSEPILHKKISAGDIIKGEESQDVLRLAISYSMLNRTEDLDYLSKSIITENSDLKNVIDFLKDTNKPINPHSVDKSLNIDRMKSFVDNQKELLFN